MASTCPHCNAALPRDSGFCPQCGYALNGQPRAETEFRSWRARVVRRQAIFCALAVPAGLFFFWQSPHTTLIVSGLGMVGLIISLGRLATLRGM